MSEQQNIIGPENKWTNLKPVQEISLERPGIRVNGVCRGLMGGLGMTAVGVSKIQKGGVRVAIVDGTGMNETSSLTPERQRAEIICEQLVSKSVIVHGLAEALKIINQTPGLREEKSANGKFEYDPLRKAWAMAEIYPIAEGEFELRASGMGDVSVLVFSPNETGDYGLAGVKFPLFNPTADQKLDTIQWNWRTQLREQISGPKVNLPKGSLIIAADDGGMQALFSAAVLRRLEGFQPESARWWETFERYSMAMQAIANLFMYVGSDTVRADQLEAFTYPAELLVKFLNLLGVQAVVERIIDTIKSGGELFDRAVPDDVGLVLTSIG